MKPTEVDKRAAEKVYDLVGDMNTCWLYEVAEIIAEAREKACKECLKVKVARKLLEEVNKAYPCNTCMNDTSRCGQCEYRYEGELIEQAKEAGI